MSTQAKAIYGVTLRNGRNYWTRIGTAFANRDGSLNLRFDYVPTDPQTTVQVREREPKEHEITAADAGGTFSMDSSSPMSSVTLLEHSSWPLHSLTGFRGCSSAQQQLRAPSLAGCRVLCMRAAGAGDSCDASA